MSLNQEQMAEFVRNHTTSVADVVIRNIKAGKVPEEWDGHELRQLLADMFAFEVHDQVMKGKRLKEYNRVRIANNLDR